MSMTPNKTGSADGLCFYDQLVFSMPFASSFNFCHIFQTPPHSSSFKLPLLLVRTSSSDYALP